MPESARAFFYGIMRNIRESADTTPHTPDRYATPRFIHLFGMTWDNTTSSSERIPSPTNITMGTATSMFIPSNMSSPR